MFIIEEWEQECATHFVEHNFPMLSLSVAQHAHDGLLLRLDFLGLSGVGDLESLFRLPRDLERLFFALAFFLFLPHEREDSLRLASRTFFCAARLEADLGPGLLP